MRSNELDLELFFLEPKQQLAKFRMKVLRFVDGVKFCSNLEQAHTMCHFLA